MKQALFLVSLVLSSWLFGVLVDCRENSLANRKATVVAVDAAGDHFRAVEVDWFPLINPRILSVKAINAQQNTGLAQIDAVQFVLDDLFMTTMMFAYFHAQADVPTAGNANYTHASAAGFAFVLRLFTVFEYDNNDGIPGYQANGNDTILGGYDLSSALLTWKPMVISKSDFTDNQGQTFTVNTIEIETVDEVFLLRFHVAGRHVAVNGVKITPETVKVDFAIRYYNNSLHQHTLYSSGPSDPIAHPNAQVGLVAYFAGIAGVAGAQSQGDPSGNGFASVSIAAGATAGFFAYSPKTDVLIQGVAETANVHGYYVNQAHDGNSQAAFAAGWIVSLMYFSFEQSRPDEIMWDPILGGQIPPTSASTSLLTSASLYTSVMALVAYYVL